MQENILEKRQEILNEYIQQLKMKELWDNKADAGYEKIR